MITDPGTWPESVTSAGGVLLVDKPAGPTSHDIVGQIRRQLPRGTRVGHAGTLDPFATGLLIVLIGRATRVQRLILGQPKTYETVARLGWLSSTGDRDGELTETGQLPPDPPSLPTGMIEQTPPVYSAIKVGGKRAYKLARAGEDVEIPSRSVEVTQFDQRWRTGGRAAFLVACSSGTYIRSLITDLGDAYCEELRRTSIGPFSLEEVSGVPLAIPDALVRLVPVVMLDADQARRLGHGQQPTAPASAPGGEVLCVDEHGEPVALAESKNGVLVASVGFRS